MKKASPNAYKLTTTFESCKLKAYKCPAGVWTIGIGHTFGVKEGMTITSQKASELLVSDYIPIEAFINANLPNLNQNQFDAICDFVFNIGVGNFKSSTAFKKIKANPNDTTIADSIRQWKYGGDGTKNKIDDDGDGLIDEAGERQRLEGLILRREAEIKLYYEK